MNKIKYKGGYKYQLHETYVIKTNVQPQSISILDYLELSTDGTLTVKKGYCWDGPSGPTYDSLNFMRGSLVHDALYQLIRNGKLRMKDRDAADDLLYKLCREDGMSRFRAWYVRLSMRTYFARSAADKSNKRKVIIAPK